jgi:hypothetical protein
MSDDEALAIDDFIRVAVDPRTMTGDAIRVTGDPTTVTGDFIRVTGDPRTMTDDFIRVTVDPTAVTGDFTEMIDEPSMTTDDFARTNVRPRRCTARPRPGDLPSRRSRATEGPYCLPLFYEPYEVAFRCRKSSPTMSTEPSSRRCSYP